MRIYTFCIRSKLDYGSIDYVSWRKSYLQVLDPIYNQALRLCLGAYRTSPCQSLYAETNELSLILRRKKLSMNYSIKLKSDPNNRTYIPGSFLIFSSRPIMSSPYCATWNKGVRLLSVLGLWSIVKTSVMSENDGTTVRQTVAHTMQLWPHGLGTSCGSRPSRRKAHE